jgi:FdrA protein
MPVHGIVRRSAYVDSVALMLAQREAREFPGVEDAGAVMATDANQALLRESGLDFPGLAAAGPDDLALVVRAATAAQAAAAVARAQEALARRGDAGARGRYRPRTIASAARLLPGANLAVISVPGRFARPVALEAMAAGLHVLLFSDNVPVEHEIELKVASRERGLLLMGPDCGTAVIGGAALGFANRVRAGRIGLAGAAGTGLQEVSTLIHRFGGGITHAIGTGGRDLSSPVGGATMLQAMRALALDPATAVIVVISKPPAAEVAGRMLAAAAACGKPVVVNFVGAEVRERSNLHSASTLEDAARRAVRLAYGIEAGDAPLRHRAVDQVGSMAAGQQFLRGLYSGGTLCYEAIGLLRAKAAPIWSNIPLRPWEALDPVTRSREHSIIDMGAGEFTQGKLHPMLDPTLRLQRLRHEAADPAVAVALLDVVLGYAAHPDPAGDLAPVIREVREAARAAGRRLVVIGSVCGTDDDPQDAAAQSAALTEAGMVVEQSNARAARLAGFVAEARGAHGVVEEPAVLLPADAPPAWPDVGAVTDLLAGRPAVVNVGLELFAESLQSQGVPVVAVDWQPPAGGKQHLMDLLDKLEG